MKKLFILGTGTDVGKTFVTGLIVKKLQEASRNPAYYKAAMSGNRKDDDGNLIPGDAEWVRNCSGIMQPMDTMCPYVYEVAVSPHLASRIEGNPVDMQVVKDGFEKLAKTYDYITVEGSGGIICPIRQDETEIMLEDIIRELNLPCLLIADAGLGTINSVVLTVSYLISKNIPVKGIIFNHYEEGNRMHEDNLKMCEKMTGLQVLAKVKAGDTNLDMDVSNLEKLYEEQV